MRHARLRAATIVVVVLCSMFGFRPNAWAADRTVATTFDNDVATIQISSYPVEALAVSALAATRCTHHSRGYQVDAYNKIGVHLWAFGAFLSTCTKNGRVVRAHWGSCWGWTGSFPDLWNFKGCSVEAQSKQRLPRRYLWRQWRGHFRYCVTWICKDVYPWVYIGGRGDGTFGTNGGQG